MAPPLWLQQILHHYRVPYEIRQHGPVGSAQELAHAEHVSGHRVAKTVLLAWGRRPVAVVVPAATRIDLERVQEVLGGPMLRLATEGEMAGWFRGCPPGAVPPLPLRSDLRILMDRSLAHLGDILFPAGSPGEAILMRFRDWYRAVRPGVGRFAVPALGTKSDVRLPRVLVVEDEADTNELFCKFLEMAGFACYGVQEGRRAVALANEVQPEAILLDLMLPDISGYDAYQQLCSQGPLKRIPFIVVSALDDEASRQRGRQLGAEAYLTKPFHPDELATELRHVLADAHA